MSYNKKYRVGRLKAQIYFREQVKSERSLLSEGSHVRFPSVVDQLVGNVPFYVGLLASTAGVRRRHLRHHQGPGSGHLQGRQSPRGGGLGAGVAGVVAGGGGGAGGVLRLEMLVGTLGRLHHALSGAILLRCLSLWKRPIAAGPGRQKARAEIQSKNIKTLYESPLEAKNIKDTRL